jgi:hypothetical protein
MTVKKDTKRYLQMEFQRSVRSCKVATEVAGAYTCQQISSKGHTVLTAFSHTIPPIPVIMSLAPLPLDHPPIELPAELNIEEDKQPENLKKQARCADTSSNQLFFG